MIDDSLLVGCQIIFVLCVAIISFPRDTVYHTSRSGRIGNGFRNPDPYAVSRAAEEVPQEGNIGARDWSGDVRRRVAHAHGENLGTGGGGEERGREG